MSDSEALSNLMVSLAVMTPFSLLSWWIIRKTPLKGLSDNDKWRAYRIRIGAGSIILLSIGLVLYFMINLIAL